MPFWRQGGRIYFGALYQMSSGARDLAEALIGANPSAPRFLQE